MKKCSKCQNEKSFSEYNKDRSRNDGYYSQCKKCRHEYSRDYVAREATKIRRKPQKEATRLKAQYNMLTSTKKKMLIDQGGKCLICDKIITLEKCHIDHDHITGLVRGLLCAKCNQGIGFFKDDSKILLRASLYLKISVLRN